MKYVVLYAGSCPGCSKVAQMVQGISRDDIEAWALEDPAVRQRLTEADLTVPDRPALLVLNDESLQLSTGWPMRIRLARVIGWRRSGTMVRLVAAEGRARIGKPISPWMPSRRGAIGSSLAGLAGLAVSGGVAEAAESKVSQHSVRIASRAESRKVLETPAAKRAVRTWGPADTQVLEVRGNGEPVFVLTHTGQEIYTFVDNSKRPERRNDHRAVSMGESPAASQSLRFYHVDGVPMADFAVSADRVTGTAVATGTAAEHQPAAVPDINRGQLACFVACVGSRVNAQCAQNCINCVEFGGAQKLVACGYCVACAGPHGVACLYDCNIL